MTAQEFEERLVAWARRRPFVDALVLAGSRAAHGRADELADWDIHILSSRPKRFFNDRWPSEIGPCWCAHAAQTPRGVIKVSVIFDGGWEVDFIPLATWQMRLVYWMMRYPDYQRLMPSKLRHGIVETRAFMLGSGFRLLYGSSVWNRRFEALLVPWPDAGMSADVFASHVAAFWQQAVWVGKKIIRCELRSAMHWLHQSVTRHTYALLAEEARIAGRTPRPEARKAEYWLDEHRLRQTSMETAVDRKVLARALQAQTALFTEVSASVAISRAFALKEYTGVATWLRTRMDQVLTEP